MKQLDFSKLSGWPASTSTWKFQQEQMLQLQMLSLLGGNNYILDGCTVVAGNTGDGWVVINGEVLPFVGGATQANVVVVDTPTNRSFFDATINPYYHDRIATFGASVTQYTWANFERNDPANGLLLRMKTAEGLLSGLQAALATTNANLGNKADKSNVLALDNTTPYVPAAQYHPATKGYVDASFGVLARGTTQANFAGAGGAGDLPAGYTSQVILLAPTVLPNSNYKVFLTLYNTNNTYAGAKWFIKDKTTSSFTITLAELDGGSTQGVYFDWMIIAN